MSFQSLTVSQIVANLIDSYTSLITKTDDMNAGSVERSVFEAFAQELGRLYQNTQESAAETQKMAAYSMFNFPRLPAQAAYTVVTLSLPTAPVSDTPVPAGTTVAVPNTSIQYKTPAAITWTAGLSSIPVTVVCTQVGRVGNQRANTVTQLVTPIQGLTNVSVTNVRDIRNGTELETEDERENRFQQWVNSLHRGDVRAILYGAKTAQLIDQYGYISEQVEKAQLVQGVGSNTLYIDNGYYTTSTQLVAQCQKVINGYIDNNGAIQVGYKAAGIPTTVQAASIQNISINIRAAPDIGYTFDMIQQSITDSVSNLVQSLDVSDSLSFANLNLAIGNVPGVLNFQVTAPAADIVPTAGTLLKLPSNQLNIVSM